MRLNNFRTRKYKLVFSTFWNYVELFILKVLDYLLMHVVCNLI